MNPKKFNLIMFGIGLICVLMVTVIIVFPMTHTREEILTIRDHFCTPGIYHIITDTTNLTEYRYFIDILVEGHTYRVRWVDGLKYDKILKWEEVELDG